MPRKDRYSEDKDPKHCGHPKQKPVSWKQRDGKGTKEVHGAECPCCGDSWPK